MPLAFDYSHASAHVKRVSATGVCPTLVGSPFAGSERFQLTHHTVPGRAIRRKSRLKSFELWETKGERCR